MRDSGVSKTFRIPVDRPCTVKQRVPYPRQARAATELQALRDISVEVPQGEFLGVIGRSESGKTTLLPCVSEILAPTEGRVEAVGRVSSFLGLSAGFHQEPTTSGNVVLALSLIGISPQPAEERIDEIIELADSRTSSTSSTRATPTA